jgi:hypothetical protein
VKRKACILLLAAWLLPACLLAAEDAADPHTPTSREKALANLEVADSYLSAGQDGEAEKRILEALEAAGGEQDIRTRSFLLLQRVNRSQRAAALERQRSLIAEAERMVADGRFDEAATLIRDHLGDFDRDETLAQANAVLASSHPNWLRRKFAELVQRGWLGDAVMVVAALLGLSIFLRLVRRAYARTRRGEWRVEVVQDAGSLGLGSLAVETLARWSEHSAAASAGLLKLETLNLQEVPRLTGEGPRIDFAPVLAELPAIGTVNLGVFARLADTVGRWLRSTRDSIGVLVLSADPHVVVRLTCRGGAGKIFTVSASGVLTELATCTEAVRSATYQMYYLIANKVSIPEAEAADRLRSGLERLRGYLGTRDPAKLKEAYETFREVRGVQPDLQEAYLYEGIALDLLERHDEAEALFDFMLRHSEGSLRQKALYNRAITHFRKYRADQLQLALADLDQLIDPVLRGAKPEPKLFREAPVPALALAARANVIAHQPIFWQRLLFGDKVVEEQRVLERKIQALDSILGWKEEVRGLTGFLRTLHETLLRQPEPAWDPPTLRQLEWAIHNSIANVHLNTAISFFNEPQIPGFDEAAEKVAFLEVAYAELRECEALLPAGVETLTNLSTALLYMARMAEARTYALAAIQANPDYEYAYYRLAQAWEKEGMTSKVEETLRSFPKSPRIPEFQELFRSYYIKPATL